MKTFVYVVSGDHGRQKIGCSDNPRQRIKELQTGSPFPLKFEFIGEAENGSGGQIEVEAHFMLAQHRAEGEWFVVPSDVAVTAVMAAAHRLGYRCKPVDSEALAPKIFEIGARGWHSAAHVICAILLLLAGGWLIYTFDQGKIGGIAMTVGVAIAIGLFKLLRYAMIRFGDSLIRIDRAIRSD